MTTTVTILWILLANGNVQTHKFPTFEACHATQQVLLLDAQIRGDQRFSRLMCIGEAQP